MEQRGFAVIYRWTVDPGAEEAIRTRWREATIELKRLGALGSCLARDATGDFVAFARWPSAAARAAAFASRPAGPPLPGVRRFEETRLDVEMDLLSPKEGT